MLKRVISLFFSVVFFVFITAPIVVILDDSNDVSYFFSMSEEEKVNEVKVFLSTNSNDSIDFSLSKRTMEKEYHLKKYSNPDLNTLSPPPDFL